MKLCEIGNNRLQTVLVKDKGKNSEKLCQILCSDFSQIASEYLELSENISARMVSENGKIRFEFVVTANRVKDYATLPATTISK